MAARRKPKPIQSNDDGRVALVDLDGTVADWDSKMETELRLLESPIESVKWHVDFSDDESYLDYRRKLVKTQPGFYRNLEPIKLGFDIVELLRKIGFELVVLTKASEKYPETWGEKVEWAQRYLPKINQTL
jgi:5'(3')-deoxyribonucleotidase